jgi:hypothetical protein
MYIAQQASVHQLTPPRWNFELFSDGCSLTGRLSTLNQLVRGVYKGRRLQSALLNSVHGRGELKLIISKEEKRGVWIHEAGMWAENSSSEQAGKEEVNFWLGWLCSARVV